MDRFSQITKYFEDPTRPPVRIAVFRKEEPSDNKFNIVENFNLDGKVTEYGTAPSVASTIVTPPTVKEAPGAYKSMVTLEEPKAPKVPAVNAPSKPALSTKADIVLPDTNTPKTVSSKAKNTKTTLLKPPPPDPEVANMVYIPDPVRYRVFASDPLSTPKVVVEPVNSRYTSVKTMPEIIEPTKVTTAVVETKPIKSIPKKTIDIIPVDQIP